MKSYLIKFGGQKASNFRDSSNFSDVVVTDPDFWKINCKWIKIVFLIPNIIIPWGQPIEYNTIADVFVSIWNKLSKHERI